MKHFTESEPYIPTEKYGRYDVLPGVISVVFLIAGIVFIFRVLFIMLPYKLVYRIKIICRIPTITFFSLLL